MEFKCSECGGKLNIIQKKDKTIYKCLKCERERVVQVKVVETVDMSETSNLDVIME